MKFFVAKNDNLFCFYCRSNLLYGEHYVGIFYRKTVGQTKVGKMLVFHLGCFPKWNEESFNRKYQEWKITLNPPKRRGRPKKYKEGYQRHKLKCLLTYHRKVGNETRVQEIQVRIIELGLS